MTLNYTTLVLDLYDGGGNQITKGTALLVPSVQLDDAADKMLIVPAPVPAAFQVTGLPQVRLLDTDNEAPLPAGWAWTITFSGVPGNPEPITFFLLHADDDEDGKQYLSGLTPVQSAVTMVAYLPLAGGVMLGALSPAAVTLADAPTIAVNAAAGNDFSVSLAGDRILGTPSNPVDRQRITVLVTSNGFSLAYSAAYNFGAAGTPALGDGKTILGFIYDAGDDEWLGVPPALGY